MTYGYKYHDKDGTVKVGEIGAPSREDAFQALRASGIKPMQFWTVETPDTATRRFGKRGVAIVVLSLALVAAVASLFLTSATPRRPVSSSGGADVTGADHLALPAPRKQLAEFPTNLVAVFRHPSERYLARYAQPGQLPGREGDGAQSLESLADDLYEALDEPIWIDPTDEPAVVELKRIVVGLKEDARKFLNTANGVSKLRLWLEERQRMEADYRNAILRGTGTADEKTEKLKAMGLR